MYVHRSNTWVIVAVQGREFAMPAAQVREIVTMPEVTAVPASGVANRGIINLRGRVLPLIDLRKFFGWQSVPEELQDFHQLMSQREEDHCKWIEELSRSVVEGSEFRLATDPHSCAFGRWYDSYRSESPWITALLQKFETPHNKIHVVASTVIGLANRGECEAAHRLIEQKRNRELREMITLFQQLKELMREVTKEVAVVIASSQSTFAVAVDRAIAVENIPSERIKEVHTRDLWPRCGIIRQAAERKATNSLAMILAPEIFGMDAAAAQ